MDAKTNRGRKVSLRDKYDLAIDDVFLSGTQALVRLCLMQAHRDRQKGLNTAGFVTGYRGSPLGGLDQQFTNAASFIDEADVKFQPGLNEDIAATAIWGTQQVALRGEGTKDGVFGLWYGKGPGVDRTGDVFRHANLAGTAENGGVLVLMGDDHTCESSTTCHQSEYALVDAMMPILNPSNIEEIVAFGLHGWALSRYSGLWVGLKCVKDNVESSGSVSLPASIPEPITPDFEKPAGGLNIRANDDRHEQERRLHQWKSDAARAYARANRLDQVKWTGGRAPKIGLISTGKSWMDLATALDNLGIDANKANDLGIMTYKVGMVWPLEPQQLIAVCDGLDLIIVVEEKRGLMETQIREILYGRSNAPVIVGKKDEEGGRLFPEEGALDPDMIARAIAARLPDMAFDQHHNCALDIPLTAKRTPYFCAGCPHSSSTILPEGSRGYAGIGCHWMSQFMGRLTEGYTHMGGEGANWIGEAPFSTRKHMFQNIGDGTYNHSGLMSIRGAIGAGVNITYKILYNEAVAMTGGQSHDGGMTPSQIIGELKGAGVKQIEIVSDRPKDIGLRSYPFGRPAHHRDDLNNVQADLAKVEGVTVLLYIQTCATEKRRQRKRGLAIDPPRRIMINEDVCEGCGDCGVQSNCVAIMPLETELGRKRAIDQSACNKDFSCLKGFCPSFVTIEGGALKKPDRVSMDFSQLKEPRRLIHLDKPMGILVTGVGGTGVVTVGALIGMAAHIEGKGAGLIDMAGLAQKGGAVSTHIRLGAHPDDIKAIRIEPNGADLMLGCDGLTSAGDAIIPLLKADAHIIANTHEMMTGQFVLDRDFVLPGAQIKNRLEQAVPPKHARFANATEIARKLLGDTIGANLFLLGIAWQEGLVPLEKASIFEAIQLNGVAIEFNKSAFNLGRLWSSDRDQVEQWVQPKPQRDGLEAILQDRFNRLVHYQDQNYAEAYREFIEKVRAKDTETAQRLTITVAKTLYKLMAYKDEYEVARLLLAQGFDQSVKEQFSGDYKITYHLAPPFLPGTDPKTGRPKKRAFGSWIKPGLALMARMKSLRGSSFDLFGKTEERRRERMLIQDYRAGIECVLKTLKDENYEQAIKIAQSPEEIKGFGPVKEKAMNAFYPKWHAMLDELNTQK